MTEIGAKNSIYTQRWQFTYNGTKNYEQNGRIGKQAANVKNKEQQLFDGSKTVLKDKRWVAKRHFLTFQITMKWMDNHVYDWLIRIYILEILYDF